MASWFQAAALSALALVGHLAIWAFIFNRTHATACPRTWRKLIEKLILLLVFGPIAWLLLAIAIPDSWRWRGDLFGIIWDQPDFTSLRLVPESLVHLQGTSILGLGVQTYFYCCCLLAIWFSIARLINRLTLRPSPRVHLERQALDRLPNKSGESLLHGWFPRMLSLVPGNQILHVSWEWFKLRIPAQCSKLSGLKICHLSDFHWTGQIDRSYYEHIFQKVNSEQPDLILITGDIVDEAECLSWIEPLIGSLRARLGIYYVLGNHDLRIPRESDIRERMARAGALSAAGQWLGLQVNGQQVWITGNELPWYGSADQLSGPPPGSPGFRILLSHSPDQLSWARQREFDLMFAGHLHGGQICFPIIGATIAPSKYGARYASGFFDIGRMLMIVSRGISGDEAIRILCPPQVSYFELVSDAS